PIRRAACGHRLAARRGDGRAGGTRATAPHPTSVEIPSARGSGGADGQPREQLGPGRGAGGHPLADLRTRGDRQRRHQEGGHVWRAVKS
ncbi:hypothetical protein ACWD4L_43610, partial [Streptomyces sp. NPDC002596]